MPVCLPFTWAMEDKPGANQMFFPGNLSPERGTWGQMPKSLVSQLPDSFKAFWISFLSFPFSFLRKIQFTSTVTQRTLNGMRPWSSWPRQPGTEPSTKQVLAIHLLSRDGESSSTRLLSSTNSVSEFTHADQAISDSAHSTVTWRQYATQDGQSTHPAPTRRFPHHRDVLSAQVLTVPLSFPCHQLPGLGRPPTLLCLPLLATGPRLTQTFLVSVFLSQTCSNISSFRPISHLREVSGSLTSLCLEWTDTRISVPLMIFSVGVHPFPSPRYSKNSLPSGWFLWLTSPNVHRAMTLCSRTTPAPIYFLLPSYWVKITVSPTALMGCWPSQALKAP